MANGLRTGPRLGPERLPGRRGLVDRGSVEGALAADDLAVRPGAVVVVDGVVPGGQVVPEHEVSWPPAEADGVVRRGRVSLQERQQGLALGLGDAGEPEGARNV
jgi:hypothetical protein